MPASVFDYTKVPCESFPTKIKFKYRLAYARDNMCRNVYKKSRNVKLNRCKFTFWGESHFNFCTHCVIMTLDSEKGHHLRHFEIQKNYRFSRFMNCHLYVSRIYLIIDGKK